MSTRITYRLPFQGEWEVVNGGVTPETSHSWNLPNQRYAYDFVKERGEIGAGQVTGNNDLDTYPSFGQAILAPADGTIVSVRDGQRDCPWPGTGAVDVLCKDVRGNYVVIRHLNNEFSLLAHLRLGSVKVAVGQEVITGQKIGECGNSGHSTEPHLHFQIQDRQSFFISSSKPVNWGQFRRMCGDTDGDSFLTRGDKVENLADANETISPAALNYVEYDQGKDHKR